MTENDKRDLVLIGASLLGIATGGILDDLRRGDKRARSGVSDAGSQAEGKAAPETGDPLAQAASASGLSPLISAPALLTATQLSRKLGEQAGLPAGRLWSQALLAFGVSAALTYFADGIRRFAPGLRGD